MTTAKVNTITTSAGRVLNAHVVPVGQGFGFCAQLRARNGRVIAESDCVGTESAARRRIQPLLAAVLLRTDGYHSRDVNRALAQQYVPLSEVVDHQLVRRLMSRLEIELP